MVLLIPWLGRDFFPGIKSGEIDMHFRAPIGLRLEEAGKVASLVDSSHRHVAAGPRDQCHRQLRPARVSGINQAYSASATIGPQDCDVTISLNDQASPVDSYRAILRDKLPKLFPGTEFTFPAGRHHGEDSGLWPAGTPRRPDRRPRPRQRTWPTHSKLVAEMRRIPGIADVSIAQSLAQPTLLVSSHRAFALGAGLTESDIANNALATLSGSGQVSPTYWLDYKTGVSHLVNMQTPQTQLTSMNDLETIPIDKGDGDPDGQGAQILGSLSQISQIGRPLEVSHRDIMPVVDIYASNADRDLGAVSDAVEGVLQRMKGSVPHGAAVQVQGQAVTMKVRVCAAAGRARAVDPARLSRNCRQLPVLARSLHHYYGPPGCLDRHRLVPVPDQHHRVGTCPDWRNHVHGDGDGELDIGGGLRPRRVGGAWRSDPRGHYGRVRALATGSDDGAGDDDRDAPDVTVQHGECAARACGDRRVAGGDVRNIAVRPMCFRLAPSQAPNCRRTNMKRRTLLMVGVPVVLVAALLVHGLVARQRSLAALTRVADEHALVPVQIISPQKGPSTRPLMLPGTVRAWYEAPIYAQVAGYVQSWDADYGAKVKAGQLLATIDTPSLDAQYAAAKANLECGPGQLSTRGVHCGPLAGPGRNAGCFEAGGGCAGGRCGGTQGRDGSRGNRMSRATPR